MTVQPLLHAEYVMVAEAGIAAKANPNMERMNRSFRIKPPLKANLKCFALNFGTAKEQFVSN